MESDTSINLFAVIGQMYVQGIVKDQQISQLAEKVAELSGDEPDAAQPPAAA